MRLSYPLGDIITRTHHPYSAVTLGKNIKSLGNKHERGELWSRTRAAWGKQYVTTHHLEQPHTTSTDLTTLSTTLHSAVCILVETHSPTCGLWVGSCSPMFACIARAQVAPAQAKRFQVVSASEGFRFVS